MKYIDDIIEKYLASGNYYDRIMASPTSVWRAGDSVRTKKMILLK